MMLSKKFPKIKNSSGLYRKLLIVLLLIAIAIQGGNDFSFFKDNLSEKQPSVSIKNIKALFPKAIKFIATPKTGYYVAFSVKGDTLGTAISSYAYAKQVKGFGGAVPVLIGLTNKRIIRGMTLLKHHESQEYMEYIIDEKLLQKWNTKTLLEAHQTKVDAITAATETSEAIIKGVNYTLSAITGNAALVQKITWQEVLQYILTACTIIFALLVCYVKKLKKYRTYMLIAVALVMGFMYKTMLSVALLHGWLINGLPWSASPMIILLLFLCVVLPFTTKKQFYCHYMCPYGAVQELAGKISPIKKKKTLKWLKWGGVEFQTILVVLLLLGLLIGVYPELSFIEPFPSFSYTIVSWWMIGFGILFIGLSFVYSKPWCRICPTGLIFDACKKQTNTSKKNTFFNMKTSEILNLLLVGVIIILLLKAGGTPQQKDHLEATQTIVSDTDKNVKVANNHVKKSIGLRPTMFPLPAVVIGSYSADGVPNIMTASWSGIVNSKPLSMAISLREATHTYKNVMSSKAFTLNYASEDLLPYVDWAGEHSGKDVQKFEKLKLTPVKSTLVNAPYVKEFPVTIELKVIKIEKLGRHTQFIGEVMDTKVDSIFLKGKNRVDIDKMKPILVGSGGGYFGFGKWLGKPGKVHKKLKVE